MSLLMALAFFCQVEFKDTELRGLALRSIGPALTSGRISDLAVDPRNRAHYYVAVACGGVWETDNAGTTFEPIFDSEGSYSIGCITIDPSNPNTIWVGTGENNSQRSVAYGDGIYVSLDGGKSWTHKGLKNSEHIGRIVVHPTDSNTLYVASQGPLWSDGGDRGLYKSTDGGETWLPILQVSEKTGINEVMLDPRDPQTIYASSYQRRRHVWTLINGGPESAVYKSTDGGTSFRKINQGLPEVHMGRIGLAIAPSQPDTLYAVVEAAQDKGGFFRSLNRGESWKKMSDYVTGSPQYYQEIFVDPVDANRIYAMDTWMQVSYDAGATFARVGETTKHVDNHALWIDPKQTDYLLAGCDGGVYETFDRGKTWNFKANLPVTQFYRVAVDNAEPYYNIYGGTQDNFTLGGPSRTENQHGIVNSDWFVVVGGDGFEPQIDPENPNIVYGQAQYGYLVRHDRATGEITDIQPQPDPAGPALRWNWDSPLLISHHQPSRLYFGSNVLFRSDDRGQSWTALGGDLTRQLDRNKLVVMGQIWPIDSVAKNVSTSIFGNLVVIAESSFDEKLVAVGTDDGLVQMSHDAGQSWNRMERFGKVPDMTYVQTLAFSQHDQKTIYASFNNHKRGDFNPYLLQSKDLGKTWTSIAKGLPERGSIYAFAEDHTDPKLLFVGTEFGLYFSIDGGNNWKNHKAGLPTIAIRDMAIQKRENDLVLGTFGRGFYVLDDYSSLRSMTSEVLNSAGHLFAIKDTRRYVPRLPLGLRDKSFQGDQYYTAANPPYGAVFTVYLKEDHESTRDQRHESEKKAFDEKKDPGYPDWDQLRAEEQELAPSAFVEISDDQGATVKRVTIGAKKGIQRANWDLRLPDPHPVRLAPPTLDNPFVDPPQGPLVAPGTYSAQLYLRKGGVLAALGQKQSFKIIAGPVNTVDQSADEVFAFQNETSALFKEISAARAKFGDIEESLKYLVQGALETPAIAHELLVEIKAAQKTWDELNLAINGDGLKGKYQTESLPGFYSRVATVVYGHWNSTGAVTQTHRDQVVIAGNEFAAWQPKHELLQNQIDKIEEKMVELGMTFTPGQ